MPTKKDIESSITKAKRGTGRGGARPGTGPKKSKIKLKQVSYKMTLQALKNLNRFARARRITANKAISIIMAEYTEHLDGIAGVYTWGGIQ